MLTVLVTGSRHYVDKAAVAGALLAFGEPVQVVHGGASGADALAGEVAVEQGWPKPLVYQADWKRHGNAAGPIRNQQMLDDSKPDVVVAFPESGSRGTWDMVSRARKANVEVRVVPPPR